MLLLLALDYCLRSRVIDSINLSAFDAVNVNLNQGDIRVQLEKLLRLDKFCVALFEAGKIPVKVKLSDKDKRQIEYGFLVVFFLSNFAPDKKFAQYFNNIFRDFYVADKIKAEPNYRFDLLAYLSAFNLKASAKYRHPQGSKIFRATLTIDDSKDVPPFVCESRSKEFANSKIWRMAYEKILAPVKLFFESVEATVNESAVSFFIRNVCRKRDLSSSFFAGFCILSADNLSKISPNICVDEHIYSYAEWLRFSCGVKKTLIATEDIRLAEIYDNIVNPAVQLQKKLISADYRLVQKIYPLSDEMAIYALNVNSDAYNYLPFVSPSVADYYDKIKAEEINFADIGILNTSLASRLSLLGDTIQPALKSIEFFCNRCKKKKTARKYAQYQAKDGTVKKFCNACYGNMLSKQKSKE